MRNSKIKAEKPQKTQVKSESEVWFVIFGAGDTRETYYGWMCFGKRKLQRRKHARLVTVQQTVRERTISTTGTARSQRMLPIVTQRS